MHTKIQERRLAVLAQRTENIDNEIKIVSASVARNIRIASSFTLGEKESMEIEKKIHMEVNKVISIPLASTRGLGLRRDLLRRLTNINEYVGHFSTRALNNEPKEAECARMKCHS